LPDSSPAIPPQTSDNVQQTQQPPINPSSSEGTIDASEEALPEGVTTKPPAFKRGEEKSKDQNAKKAKGGDEKKKKTRNYMEDADEEDPENGSESGDEDDFEVGPPQVVNAFGGETVTGIRGLLNRSMQRKQKDPPASKDIAVVRPGGSDESGGKKKSLDRDESESRLTVSSSMDGFAEVIVENSLPTSPQRVNGSDTDVRKPIVPIVANAHPFGLDD
jgi:hypothetical protein